MYIEIRMPHIDRRKAITGFRTLVITRGEQVKPKGKPCHSNISPSHLNLRYFFDSGLIGICKNASRKSNPIQNALGCIQSRTFDKVSIVKVYFFT